MVNTDSPFGDARLGLATLMIHDYDEAIRFFVDVLDFELVEDAPSVTNGGRPKRWVVVCPRGGATAILLAQADGERQSASVGDQTAGRVAFFLRVSDFESAYQRLVDAEVAFARDPFDAPYGRCAVFHDVAGNRWDLLGPPKEPA
jgi:predicted enzyme related to lactoylglutathione lyase